MNSLVLAGGAGWLIGSPIILKYVVLDKRTPFQYISSSLLEVPFFNYEPTDHNFDTFSYQALQILKCTLLDTFLNLPLPSTSASLWTVGWNSNFQWGDNFSGRCSIEWHYEFVQLMSLIFMPGTCVVRDFNQKMVSFSHFDKNTKEVRIVVVVRER
jgi:hypothetical protein